MNCNGSPGKPGFAGDIPSGIECPEDERCPGCSVCHPSDCIWCEGSLTGTRGGDGGACTAYHGPDCFYCGGTGRVQWDYHCPIVKARVDASGPCPTYRSPE